jgi:hypothetical protein
MNSSTRFFKNMLSFIDHGGYNQHSAMKARTLEEFLPTL